MNIRSLTAGVALPPGEGPRAELIEQVGDFMRTGREALETGGFEVQTTRLSFQPLERWLDPGEDAVRVVTKVADDCRRWGIDYCSLGTIQAAGEMEPERLAALCDAIPDFLAASDSLFASVQVAARSPTGGVVNRDAVRASARIIERLAGATSDGFRNLRFAAAANCPPHVPFYPASYYVEDELNGGGPEFGLALEAADLAVRAFEQATTQDEARSRLLGLLEQEAGKAAEVCVDLATRRGYTFTGVDISMAPYPDSRRSVAGALERLNGAPLGSPGSLAAAAFVTDILREARLSLPSIGYSGLMLPVLEDETLSARAAEGLVTIDTLLLLSAVCGLGLDTIPLPGSTSARQIEKIILDMASLAVRLNKPLTARLLPVPGRSAGDPAEWEAFSYFAKGRVMAVPGSNDGPGLLDGGRLDFA